MLGSPFHFYNLRRNPFGELERNERAELAVTVLDPWLEFLRHPSSVLQFVGDCGRGKSTHLLAIEKHLSPVSFVYIPEDGPRPKLPQTRPLIVDEAQRLSLWQRRKLGKFGGPIVIGSHIDHTREFERCKLNVQTVFVAELVTPDRIQLILNKRIESSRLNIGTIPTISGKFALRLHQQFGSDLRGMEHYLYNEFQAHTREQREWPLAN
jgi:hypothetical protein